MCSSCVLQAKYECTFLLLMTNINDIVSITSHTTNIMQFTFILRSQAEMYICCKIFSGKSTFVDVLQVKNHTSKLYCISAGIHVFIGLLSLYFPYNIVQYTTMIDKIARMKTKIHFNLLFDKVLYIAI